MAYVQICVLVYFSGLKSKRKFVETVILLCFSLSRSANETNFMSSFSFLIFLSDRSCWREFVVHFVEIDANKCTIYGGEEMNVFLWFILSESERAERERKGDLDQYERLDGDRNVTSRVLAVKKVIIMLLSFLLKHSLLFVRLVLDIH